jgi:hypothetical protein
MGTIRRFALDRIARRYKTSIFFETGTFKGDGVQFAMSVPFRQLISVEIVPELAEEAKRRFCSNQIVSIVNGESAEEMEKILPRLKGNCLFWLDAHFPGADAGLTQYDDNIDEAVRLPLKLEAGIIHQLRPRGRDVIIMDDLRIYEDGPYHNGNVPKDAMPRSNRNIDFVFENFGATHDIHRLFEDEGYLLLLPKPSWWKLIDRFKKPVPATIYINEQPGQ